MITVCNFYIIFLFAFYTNSIVVSSSQIIC